MKLNKALLNYKTLINQNNSKRNHTNSENLEDDNKNNEFSINSKKQNIEIM